MGKKDFLSFLKDFFFRKVDAILIPFLLLISFLLLSSYFFFFYLQSQDVLLSDLFSDVTRLFFYLFLIFGFFLTFYYAYRHFKEENVDHDKNWDSIRELPEKYDVDIVARLVKLEYRIKKLEAQSLLRVSVYAFLGAVLVAIIITFISKFII